ncbi:MAG: hypothetical protein G01um101470_13 [Parcubacteria group bacterium Gr01-1014_70]|nr:MAG: hypothetical protein G01um101470_13 [Parcubacteria group bacterium Gr01-1014_70]
MERARRLLGWKPKVVFKDGIKALCTELYLPALDAEALIWYTCIIYIALSPALAGFNVFIQYARIYVGPVEHPHFDVDWGFDSAGPIK